VIDGEKPGVDSGDEGKHTRRNDLLLMNEAKLAIQTSPNRLPSSFISHPRILTDIAFVCFFHRLASQLQTG